VAAFNPNAPAFQVRASHRWLSHRPRLELSARGWWVLMHGCVAQAPTKVQAPAVQAPAVEAPAVEVPADDGFEVVKPKKGRGGNNRFNMAH
jgi:hypothetical protein